MDKLEETKELAKQVEEATDKLAQERAILEFVSRPYNEAITGLLEQVRKLTEKRDAYPTVQGKKAHVLEAEKALETLTADLLVAGYGLVDDGAFFPSGKKSQILTNRVTLKSQMPKLPEVVDPMSLVEALVADERLWEFVKGISIKLDNDVAEAIMRWWKNREDKDVGLETPQPKILNIKVKEETE